MFCLKNVIKIPFQEIIRVNYCLNKAAKFSNVIYPLFVGSLFRVPNLQGIQYCVVSLMHEIHYVYTRNSYYSPHHRLTYRRSDQL